MVWQDWLILYLAGDVVVFIGLLIACRFSQLELTGSARFDRGTWPAIFRFVLCWPALAAAFLVNLPLFLFIGTWFVGSFFAWTVRINK